MARSRDLRPEYFTDEKVGELPYGARILFAGIWCHSDLNGVFEYSARQLRVLIFPYDEGLTSDTVQGWLNELEAKRMITRFEARDEHDEVKQYGYVRNWAKHQSISTRERDIGTRRPPPPDKGNAQVKPGSNPGSTQNSSPSPSPSPSPAPAVVVPAPAKRDQPPPPTSADGITDDPKPAIVVRGRGLGDLREVCRSLLIMQNDDRERADAILRLYGWDACVKILRELEPIAAKREPGKRRVLVSEWSDMMAERYELDPEDYVRAGFPVPEGKRRA